MIENNHRPLSTIAEDIEKRTKTYHNILYAASLIYEPDDTTPAGTSGATLIDRLLAHRGIWAEINDTNTIERLRNELQIAKRTYENH